MASAKLTDRASFGIFCIAVAFSACGQRHPPAVTPAASAREGLIDAVKAFQQTLGVEPTGNFLRYSETGTAARCYFTGILELPGSYRGLQLREESKAECAAREDRYDVFFYPVEVVASGRAPITPALADGTVERLLVVVPHEDFHNQSEARGSPPEMAEAAATLAGFLTATEFAKVEYGEGSGQFQRLSRDAGLFRQKAEVVNNYYDRLSALYRSFQQHAISQESALSTKAELFSLLQHDCSAITPEPASFNKCPAALNNAGLAFDRTYTQRFAEMFDVYLQSGEDTRATIAQLKRLLSRAPK